MEIEREYAERRNSQIRDSIQKVYKELKRQTQMKKDMQQM